MLSYNRVNLLIMRSSAPSFFFSSVLTSVYLLIVSVEVVVVVVALDHTQTHKFGRTPLDEGSGLRTDLYLTTLSTHKIQTDIHVLGGIRTHNANKRVAADPRLRPRGHSDRPYSFFEPCL